MGWLSAMRLGNKLGLAFGFRPQSPDGLTGKCRLS